MRSVQLELDDILVPADVRICPDQTQWIDERFAAFDHAFHAEQQSPPTEQTNNTPRYVPWPTEAAAAAAPPWSPEILNSDQLERSPGAQELLYGPAWDSHPRHRATFKDERLFPGGDFAEELDQDDSSGSDAHLVDVLLPEDNIDPPPPPDPVGPPSQMADRKDCLSRKTSKARQVGGRRRQPLKPHSRHNAKMIRRAQGQCWSCTLQRNPV